MKMKLSTQRILAIFFALSLLSFAIYKQNFRINAQLAAQSLEITPPTQEIKADPGQNVTVKVKLRNNTPSSLPITVKIEDFTANGEDGQVELSSNSKWGAAGWTRISPDKFNLNGGSEQEVTAEIKIPSNATGGHYGAIVFGVDAGKQPNAASVSQQIASLFLLKISGPVDESIALTAFSAPKFREFGPIPFDLTFQNNGNVHLKPSGIISVTDMFGHKTDVLVKGANVFPEASRIIRANFEQKMLFGKYDATAIMYVGSKGQTLTASTSFVVIPVRVIGAILIVLFVLFLARRRLKKVLKTLFS